MAALGNAPKQDFQNGWFYFRNSWKNNNFRGKPQLMGTYASSNDAFDACGAYENNPVVHSMYITSPKRNEHHLYVVFNDDQRQAPINAITK
jgi:hypothetical protein